MKSIPSPVFLEKILRIALKHRILSFFVYDVICTEQLRGFNMGFSAE